MFTSPRVARGGRARDAHAKCYSGGEEDQATARPPWQASKAVQTIDRFLCDVTSGRAEIEALKQTPRWPEMNSMIEKVHEAKRVPEHFSSFWSLGTRNVTSTALVAWRSTATPNGWALVMLMTSGA